MYVIFASLLKQVKPSILHAYKYVCICMHDIVCFMGLQSCCCITLSLTAALLSAAGGAAAAAAASLMRSPQMCNDT